MKDNEYFKSCEEERKSRAKSSKSLLVYRLGEEIANGVRYFGAESRTDKGEKVAKCICPVCGEAWRVVISNVKSGSVKSCCYGNKPNKGVK